MIPNLVLFGLALAFSALAVWILKICRFQPWNLEFCIRSKISALPWYITRSLAYLCGAIIIAPAALFFWLATQVKEELKFRGLALGFIALRLYAQFFFQYNAIFTKYSNRAMVFFYEYIRSILFWTIQLLLSGCFSHFNHVSCAATFLSMDFIFIARFVYASSEDDTINISYFYRRCIEFFRSKAKPPGEDVRPAMAEPEVAKTPLPARDDMPSIPDEYPVPGANEPNSLELPQIPMENVKTPLPSPPEYKAQQRKDAVGAFSSVCQSRIIQMDSNYKAELDNIVSFVTQSAVKNRLLRITLYLVGHFALLALYAAVNWYNSDS